MRNDHGLGQITEEFLPVILLIHEEADSYTVLDKPVREQTGSFNLFICSRQNKDVMSSVMK